MAAIKHDLYYIHDFLTANYSNQSIYFSLKNEQRNRDLKSIVPDDYFRYIKEHMMEESTVVHLLCHKYSDQKVLDQSKYYVFTVLAQQYTFYTSADKGCDNTLRMKVNSIDCHFCEEQVFNMHTFYCYEKAQHCAKSIFQENKVKIYGNSHQFLHEFCKNVYNIKVFDSQFQGRHFYVNPSYLISSRLGSKPKYIEDEFLCFKVSNNWLQNYDNISNDHIVFVDDTGYDIQYKVKLLSLDIETVALDLISGKDNGESSIIQICIIVNIGRKIVRSDFLSLSEVMTDTEYYISQIQNLFTDSENIYSEPVNNLTIHCLKTEKDLLLKTLEVIADINADFIMGYNVRGFDLPILFRRGMKYNINFPKELSRFSYSNVGIDILQAKLRNEVQNTNRKIRLKNNKSDMLTNKYLNVDVYALTGILIIDLYDHHKNQKLDIVCKTVFNTGKKDIPYSQIYSHFKTSKDSRSELLLYCAIDVYLCVALFFVDDFARAYKLHMMNSVAMKIPHSLFFDNRKTSLIFPLIYNYYLAENLLSEGVIYPKRSRDKYVVNKIFQRCKNMKVHVPDDYKFVEEAFHMFLSGEIKINTPHFKNIYKHVFSDYAKNRADQQETLSLLSDHLFYVKKFKLARLKYDTCYTLSHLFQYIYRLSLNRTYDFSQTLRNAGLSNDVTIENCISQLRTKGYSKQKSAQIAKELNHFFQYVSFFYPTNKHLSLEKVISNFKKNISFIGAVDKGLTIIFEHFPTLYYNFLKIVDAYQRQTIGMFNFSTFETFANGCVSTLEKHLTLDLDTPIKYDGAYVHNPIPGLIINWTSICLDFKSMYPCILIEKNLGPDTMVSLKTIKRLNLKLGEDIIAVNLNKYDDFRTVDLTGDSNVEIRYAFFLTNKHKVSIFAKLVDETLQRRFFFKSKWKDHSLPENKREYFKILSDSLKIIANSMYGICPKLGFSVISRVITSIGRQYIQNVIKYFERKGCHTIYGDTDSCFITLPENNSTILNMYKNKVLPYEFDYQTVDKLLNVYETKIIKHYATEYQTENSTGEKENNCTQLTPCNGDSALTNVNFDFNRLQFFDRQRCGIIVSHIACNLVKELNEKEILYSKPSELEMEKIMVPFFISKQKKKYLGLIIDPSGECQVLNKGYQLCRRTASEWTVLIQQTLINDILKNASIYNTYQLMCKFRKELKTKTIDLSKIAISKTFSISKFSPTMKTLYTQMLKRSEIQNVGLDRITVRIIYIKGDDKKHQLIETLEYLNNTYPMHSSCRNKIPLDDETILRDTLKETLQVVQHLFLDENIYKRILTDADLTPADLNITKDTNAYFKIRSKRKLQCQKCDEKRTKKKRKIL